MRKSITLLLLTICIFALSGCIKMPEPQAWVFINKQGKIIYAPRRPSSFPPPYGSGLIGFEKNGKWGCLNKHGQVVIAPVYDDLDILAGSISVRKGPKWIYINERGLEVSRPKLNAYDSFDMKPLEEKLRSEKYENWSAGPTEDGLIRVKRGVKWGFYDVNRNKIFIHPQYDEVRHFEGKFAAAKLNGLWGFIDRTGQFVIKPQFDYEYVDSSFQSKFTFKEGVAGIKKNGLWGYIDATGRFVIKPQFSRISDFSDGAAAVRKDARNTSLYGYIDKRGMFITPQTYRQAYPFKHGVAAVVIGKPE